MDGGDSRSSSSTSSNSGGNARWNPTKEQISVLEDLYKQGMRTPSAEQIHQITRRLTDFGHIEGKNVFYWFQNHKARQRQKQKQETLDRFNRYLHCQVTPHVYYPPHPSSPTVCYNPYYLPPSDPGLYQQCPINMMPPSTPVSHSGSYDQMVPSRNSRSSNNDQETLDLFPIHPTGILQEKCSTDDDSSTF